MFFQLADSLPSKTIPSSSHTGKSKAQVSCCPKKKLKSMWTTIEDVSDDNDPPSHPDGLSRSEASEQSETSQTMCSRSRCRVRQSISMMVLTTY